MNYKIPDAEFEFELWFNCYFNQIDGYPFGHPARVNFKPIVVTIPDGKGGIDRERTINGPAYTFTPQQKSKLLEVAGLEDKRTEEK